MPKLGESEHEGRSAAQGGRRPSRSTTPCSRCPRQGRIRDQPVRGVRLQSSTDRRDRAVAPDGPLGRERRGVQGETAPARSRSRRRPRRRSRTRSRCPSSASGHRGHRRALAQGVASRRVRRPALRGVHRQGRLEYPARTTACCWRPLPEGQPFPLAPRWRAALRRRPTTAPPAPPRRPRSARWLPAAAADQRSGRRNGKACLPSPAAGRRARPRPREGRRQRRRWADHAWDSWPP